MKKKKRSWKTKFHYFLLYFFIIENGSKNLSFVFDYNPDQDKGEGEKEVEKEGEGEDKVVSGSSSSSISVNKQIRIIHFCDNFRPNYWFFL